MIFSRLHINLTSTPISFKVSVSEFCSTAVLFEPLLVDEGYLFVDFNGGYTQLLVDKK